MPTSVRSFALLYLLSVASAFGANTRPNIVVDSTSVIGSGFANGHHVAIFGAANVPQPFGGRLIDYMQIVVADSTGNFRWTANEEISRRSVWFAVDVSTAEYAVGSPGSDLPLAALSPPAVRPGRDPMNDALAIIPQMVNVLVVRPNDSVWTSAPIRHGSSDLNGGKPGSMQADLSQLRHIHGNVHGAGHLLPADLVIMIDPVSLVYYAGHPNAN
jgi:hypothetical protein